MLYYAKKKEIINNNNITNNNGSLTLKTEKNHCMEITKTIIRN